MKPKSTQRALGSIVLAFQAFAVFFATLVSFGLKVADGPTVWIVGLSLSTVTILLPGLLGRPGSYAVGWALQVSLLGLSIWISTFNGAGIFFVIIQVLFVGMWIWGMLAGSTVDAARRAWIRDNEQSSTQNPDVFVIESEKDK
jgi:hypothetical protein